MQQNPSNTYKYHVANLRELQLAISHTGRLARETVASRDPHNSLRSLLRLYSLLIGAWAETRLKKLIHEEHGFSEPERQLIENEATQLAEWQKCIELAFRKHYGITRANLSDLTLGVANFARYNALIHTLNNELKIIIEIRNKLAHGQWFYPFSSDGKNIESNKYQLINKENIQTLQFKYDLIVHLANLVHDLIVSSVTFERDFEKNYSKLNQVRINISRKDYNKYEKKLINSRVNARLRKP